ncbi:uncharacterized protein LOC143057480 [Mytilus galloprovincialis]|uniref:uncharacterized protein LOC143057480 n=1 Tax=Mytilus galloprovincialis TaxID=29158 RepID=UPI003F7C83DC
MSLLWALKSDDTDESGITEYKTVTVNEMPWRVKKLDKKYKRSSPWSEGITNISDIQGDLDILICDMIVGVCLEECKSEKKEEDKEEEVEEKEEKEEDIYDKYHTALSMYLLKMGDWKISKTDMTRPFSQKALDYIYEETQV